MNTFIDARKMHKLTLENLDYPRRADLIEFRKKIERAINEGANAGAMWATVHVPPKVPGNSDTVQGELEAAGYVVERGLARGWTFSVSWAHAKEGG